LFRKHFAAYLSDELVAPVVRSVGSVAMIRISGGLLLFVAQVLLARWMGAEHFGAFSFATAWGFTLAVLASFGWQGTGVRYIAEYLANNAHARIAGLMRYSYRISVLSGSAIAIITVAVLIAAPGLVEPAYHLPLLAAAPGIPVAAFFVVQSAHVRGFRWMVLAFIPEQIVRPLLLIAIAAVIALILPGATPEYFVAASVLAYFGAAWVQHVALRRRLDPAIRTAAPEYATVLWLRTSVPLFFMTGSRILLDNTTLFLVGILLTPADTGIYTAALRSATLVGFINVIANVVVQPDISALYSQGRRAELQQLIVRIARLGLAVSTVMAVAITVFGDYVLGMFGEEYREAYATMAILVAGHVLTNVFGPVTGLLIMTGHQNISAQVFGLGVISNVLLNLLMISRFGIEGAAAATAGNLLIMSFVLYRVSVKRLEISPAVF